MKPQEEHRRGARSILATTATLLCLATATYAEPAAPTTHVPILGAMVGVGAVLSGMIPLLLMRLMKPDRHRWAFWTAAVLMALLFLILLGPIIMVFGSILITGRTM